MKPIPAMERFVALCVLTLIVAATILAQTPAAKKPLTFSVSTQSATNRSIAGMGFIENSPGL